MDWDFIIQCLLALGLSASLLALLDSRIRLKAEKKKTSIYCGISKNLEGDTWKQKDTIDVQQGTIEEQNGTIREQKQEIENLEADLKESRAMAARLMQLSCANAGNRNTGEADSTNANAGTGSCNCGAGTPDARNGLGCTSAVRGNPEVRPLTQRLLMLSDELANICYESSSRPDTMGRRIRQTLHTGLTDRETLEQIDTLIEASYPGFLSDLRSAFPWMTEDDSLLVSLMCCGFSPNAVSIILGTDLNRLSKWKTRLARQMNSPVRLSKFLNEKLLAYCNEARSTPGITTS